MEQLSILDFLEELEEDIEKMPSDSDPNTDILTIDDLHFIRDSLLVGTCQKAFGISKNGKGKPSKEAWDWILSKDQKLPLSFNQCCQEFGADPDTAKQLLLSKYFKLFDA